LLGPPEVAGPVPVPEVASVFLARLRGLVSAAVAILLFLAFVFG